MFTALREFMGREDGCINKYASGQVTQMESVRLPQGTKVTYAVGSYSTVQYLLLVNSCYGRLQLYLPSSALAPNDQKS